MPLHYLSKLKREEAEERQRLLRAGSRPRTSTNANASAASAASASSTSGRSSSIPISFTSIVLVAFVSVIAIPLFLYLPWILSALPMGSRMPHFWVRSTYRSTSAASSVPIELPHTSLPKCQMVQASQAAHGTDDRNSPFGEGDSGNGGLKYCEDLELVPGTQGTVLASCDPSRAGWNTVMGPLRNPSPRGSLWTIEYLVSEKSTDPGSVPVAHPVRLVGYPTNKDFHPLGTAMYDPSSPGKGDDHDTTRGPKRLFAVNHARNGSTVEVFDLSRSSRQAEPLSSTDQHTSNEGEPCWVAKYRRTIIHPLATHTPNSIHAITPTSFFVTNDHLFARRPGPYPHMVRVWETALQFKSPRYLGFLSPLNSWLRGKISPRVASLLSNRRVAASLAKLETLLGLPLGWVTYVEFTKDDVKADPIGEEDYTAAAAERGVRAEVVANGIPFANGIAVTDNQKLLVVASTTYPGVWMYDVEDAPRKGGGKRVANRPWSDALLRSTAREMRLKLRTKLYLPFWVDNLGWARGGSGGEGPQWGMHAREDPFEGQILVATGHPSPFELIRMAQAPESRTSPSWSVAIQASSASSSSSPSYLEEREDEQDKEQEERVHPDSVVQRAAVAQRMMNDDIAAPLPAHTRVLGHNPEWSIFTLAQNNGVPLLTEDNSTAASNQDAQAQLQPLHLPSSSSSVWDRTAHTFLMSGLYANPGVLFCTQVAVVQEPELEA